MGQKPSKTHLRDYINVDLDHDTREQFLLLKDTYNYSLVNSFRKTTVKRGHNRTRKRANSEEVL